MLNNLGNAELNQDLDRMKYELSACRDLFFLHLYTRLQVKLIFILYIRDQELCANMRYRSFNNTRSHGSADHDCIHNHLARKCIQDDDTKYSAR